MISPKKVRDQGDMGFFYQPLSPDRTYGLFAFGAFFHLADAHQIEIGLGGDFFSVYNGFQYRYFFRPDRFFSPVVGVGLSQERCCGETELVTNLATGSLGLNLNLGPGPIQLSKMWPVDVNPGLIGELILAPGFCEIGGDRSKTGWPIQYGYCGIGLWQIKMGAKF